MTRWAAILSGLLSIGCPARGRDEVPRPPPADEPEPSAAIPGILRPPADMGADIQWEQRVVARWDEESHTFDAVLSKTGDELVLLGLGPMKAPGFVVRLHDGVVDLDNRTDRAIPFDPKYMILDVQRVFFPWIPGAPPSDGTRSHERDGELISERWEGGRLVERRFRRRNGHPPGEIVIRYRMWIDGADAPRHAELDNGWFGYSLAIETLAQQRL
jgi:hypothetical protein